jgi:predicted RNA-binding Zn-ribbon protein involved in translation (DUF1610 family)
MKLNNFFYDCGVCGHTLRFDDTAQTHKCPKCGCVVQLNATYQRFLIDERAQIKAAPYAEQLA